MSCGSITFYSGLVAILSTTILKLLFIKLMIKTINTRSYTLKKSKILSTESHEIPFIYYFGLKCQILLLKMYNII